MQYFKQWILFTVIITSTHLVHAQNFNSENKVKEILGFKEGTYETVLAESKFTDNTFCEDALLELKFIEIEKQKSLTLVIGEKLSFPELQEKKYFLSSEKGCTLKLTNEVKKNELIQFIHSDCPKNKEVFTKEHRLTSKDNSITYTYTFTDNINKKPKPVTQLCVYQIYKKEYKK